MNNLKETETLVLSLYTYISLCLCLAFRSMHKFCYFIMLFDTLVSHQLNKTFG